MVPFLKQFAIDIYEKHKAYFSEICIVMPTRRSQKYFINYLHEYTQKTILLPEIYTIDEFVCNLTSFKTIDKTEILLLLYNYQLKTDPDLSKDFKHFIGWATLFLSDINEIDMQLADSKNIFTSLTDIKELSYYDIPENERTPMQMNHLRFFSQLYQYYQYLHQELSEKSIGYQGLIYRKAADEIHLLSEKFTWKKVIFCGFNALTKSETFIIKHLMHEQKAETYWDADALYFNDEMKDAGYFLRNIKKDFALSDDFPYLSNYFEQNPKKINIIGAPNAISQVKLVGELMDEYKSNNLNSDESFVIVPADEKLLPTIMNTLNPNDINITMGMPLNLSIIYKLYSLFFGMHINFERSKNLHNRNNRYIYYKDIVGIFSHPILNSIAKSYKSSLDNAIYHLTLQNIVYCNIKNIEKLDGITPEFMDSVKILFEKHDDFSNLLSGLKQLNDVLKNNIDLKKRSLNDIFNQSALNYFDEIFEFLEELFKNYSICNNAEFLYNLFNSKVSEYTISFIGDAIKGMQLMGLLETRLLDFDHIILISVNEETIPVGKSTNSLLPYDLRRYFNLHSHIQKDAVYSYHFFRLIQRAKNVTLIYNADLKDGKSEKSRYINQLIYDIAPKCASIEISEKILNISPKLSSSKSIIIHKDGNVLQKLSQIKTLSPSAISNFIQCPLKFYFSKVAKIEEIEDITESTDDKMLGNIIHAVLEKTYKQFPKGERIREENFSMLDDSKLFEKIEQEYENLQNQKIPVEDLKFGKNRLAFEVIKNFIVNFLKNEKIQVQANEIIPIDFEQKTDVEIPISSNIIQKIKLNGIIDRIDQYNGIIRIIDYKTGKVENNNLTFQQFSELFTEPKLAKSLQLMCYSLLYYKNNQIEGNLPIQPMIISFKNKDIYSPINYSKQNTIKIEEIKEFEEFLITFIAQIFNESVPFEQTTDSKTCSVCQFKSICNIDSNSEEE